MEEAKKQGDIVLNVDQDTMHIKNSGKRDSEWKKTFTNTSQSTTKLANELNTLLKEADKDTPNTPTWLNASKEADKAKADDRAYRLLTTLIPGAKKIIYHVNDDQLEVETKNYTYTAARNGSKEAGIQGSDIEATASAATYDVDPRTFERENTNTKANVLNNGWARSGSEEFKHFSHFVGVDKGIERTKVLTDKELSAKIRDAVGPGDSNLGKGGYFSTGDVLLGKDVVSYTVQVFSENNDRVGVNPQSHRVQYNLPILADFSVIQDTVEPSRNVVEKIIPKLNIPEEEKKKITEKIKEKKKTSELADLISGNVKVRYVDEQGRLLSLKNDTGIGEKESDGTYITNKKQLIGTSYDVTDKKLSSLTTTDGTYYTFKESDTNFAGLTGNIVSEGRTVTLVYKESEAPAATGNVTVKYENEAGETIAEANELKKDVETGTDYNAADAKKDRIEKDGKVYKYKAVKAGSAAETGKVSDTEAVITYVYELVKTPDNSTPDKPIPEKPEIPSPQEPGTPGEPTPDKPNPQPNPEHPSVPTSSPELPNQETPIPEPTPEPDTPKPETPVSPDPEVPTYETGKREELPNTGTEANAGLAGAGLLTLLAGLGLGFFKKKEDESE